MKKKTKIFFVTECPYSGILQAMIENAKILKEMSFDIFFIVPEDTRDRYGELLSKNKKKLCLYGKVIHSPLKKKYFSIIFDKNKLREFFKKESNFLVISYGSYAGKICRILFREKYINILYHSAQCIDFKRMKIFSRLIEYFFEKLLIKNASYYLACSPSECSVLLKLGSSNEKIIFCPNAVTIEKNRNNLRKKYWFVVIGRILKSKGIFEILEACKLTNLLDKILVIGDGKELNFLKSKYPEVNFLGNIDHSEVCQYLDLSKFFVSNSIVEGLSFSLIEAMSRGVVPIVSKVDGHEDIIVDGYNGFLFEKNKNIEKALLKSFLIEENFYKILSENAVCTIENISNLVSNNFFKHFKKYE